MITSNIKTKGKTILNLGIVLLILSIIAGFTVLPVFAKSERTYYTEEKIAVAKNNIEKYAWAKKIRDEIISRAEHWAKYSDDRLRTLVPPPEVPRAIVVNNLGCPIHGSKVRQEGSYKWIIDFERPWKIKCPVGGEEYPSNDFAKFLESGMKDRSLLTGDYPDDGWGWEKKGLEKKFWFVGYYAHWSARHFLLPAIYDLSLAALLTGDSKYAHKAALLLWQLAQYYPDYQYEKQSRYGTEFDSGYLGKLFYHTWEVAQVSPEETFPPPIDTYAQAYDAIHSFLKNDKELQNLTGQTAEQIDADIRERLLLEAARSIMDGSHRIFGNYGSHQRALVRLSLVLDEKKKHPTSLEMLDWVLKNQEISLYTDMGIKDSLVNIVLRDGVPFESPIYNYSEWMTSLTEVAEAFLDLNINLFKDQRFQKLLTWPFEMLIAGQFMPSIGDSGNMFAINEFWDLNPNMLRLAFEQTGDLRIAQALLSTKNLPRDLFKKAIEEVLPVTSEISLEPLGTKSKNFSGYGLANLQSGSNENCTASSLFYGYFVGHNHSDDLNMTFYSQGNALLTDFGYPETSDKFDHRRYGFFENTVAHNTVVVDASKQDRESRGKLFAFDPTSFAKIVEASCEEAYPDKVSLYRRVNMLVEATPSQNYLFDIFYVQGGEQHDYVVHGPQAELFCESPLGPVQKEGTLAGLDVPYGQFYDDLSLKDKPIDTVSYGSYQGSGYQFLFNVQRVPLKETTICHYQLTEPKESHIKHPWKDIGLRAHLISNNDEELIVCDGRPQETIYMPETVKFILRRRTGENLKSTFISIFEPFEKETWIKRVSPVLIEPADGQAVAILVELVDNSKHYLFHSLEPEKTYTIDDKIKVEGQAAALVLDSRGRPLKAMLFNGKELSLGKFFLKGRGLQKTKIVSVDYEKGIVEIADPLLSNNLREDQIIIIAPASFADSLTLKKVIDKTHFSIGDEDLRVATSLVEKIILSENQIVSPTITFFAQPGMTVLNSHL